MSKELEKEIALTKRKVELITALINDIDDEELQGEYMQGFEAIRNISIFLANEYVTNGLTEESEAALKEYKRLTKQFEEEYEL